MKRSYNHLQSSFDYEIPIKIENPFNLQDTLNSASNIAKDREMYVYIYIIETLNNFF